MGLAAKLDRFIPDLSAALARFPVPAALSVALCIYWNVMGAERAGDDSWHVIAGASAAFIASGAAHLFAEGNKWPRLSGILLALAAGAALAVAGFFTAVFQTSLLFLFAGLIPVLMIAAYMRADVKQAALWLFNLRFGLAALLAFIVALLFAAGLSFIVEALNFLFEAGIGGNLEEHIWGTAAILIGPIYGLSLMPRDLDEEIDIVAEKGTLLERGVSVLVNYILVPVVIVYALILHAYAVKIGLDGVLPKGQVATMVSIFAVAGTGCWLVAWPWRETGTKLLRLFMGGWFFLTIVPAMLLAIAIWRRLADYGVTPDRYGIVLVAIWIAVITAYLAARRNRADMRVILGAVAVLLLVGSVGPFGANGLTISSQVQRLGALLDANGLLKDGKAVAPKERLTNGVTSDGYSILHAIQTAGGLDRLKPWFDGAEKNPFQTGNHDWALTNDIATWLGFTTPMTQANSVSFTANAVLVRDLAGSNRLLGPFRAMRQYNPNEVQPDMSARFDTDTLTIKAGSAVWTMPVAIFLQKAKAGVVEGSTQPPVAFEIAPGVTVMIDSIYGILGDRPSLSSASFWIIVK